MVIRPDPVRADLRSFHVFIAHDSRYYANEAVWVHGTIGH